jgi:hypothetical protein
MLVLSVGAVMAAMLVLSAVPAMAQDLTNASQVSGAAMSNLLVNAEKAGNVAVQQANNVNTGNNQQNLLNLQANAQINANVLTGDDNRIMETGPGDLNAASNNTATQSNTATNTQNGITQINMAQQSVAQALAIVR